MNVQREIIYSQRRTVLNGDNIRDNIISMIEESAGTIVDTYREEIEDGSINRETLANEIYANLALKDIDALKADKLKAKDLEEELRERAVAAYETKEIEIGEPIRELERIVLLKVVDNKWMDHIDAMDSLKNGIGLRAYGQKNPVDQYRIDGGDMFYEMITQIKLEVSKILLHVRKQEKVAERQSVANITGAAFDRTAIDGMNIEGESKPVQNASEHKPEPIKNDGPKVGRNDPCPCGSGKKYKNCCGK
jgi:preprotein translocase subunit SecA